MLLGQYYVENPMAEERVQRRLAAILAADVVGFSRMMEADEAGTLATLKARRRKVLEPLVTKYQGRIWPIADVTTHSGPGMSASGGKADIPRQQGYVRF